MRKAALIILDGAGWRESTHGNAVTEEHLPQLFSGIRQYGVAVLQASGAAVGLEDGQVGNSEAGHLTIGAGRMVPSLARSLLEAYTSGSWAKDPTWHEIAQGGTLHIVGLLSDAGVHALARTLHHTLRIAHAAGVAEILVHPVLDGVDSPAGSAPNLLDALEREIAGCPRARLGVVQGRRAFADRSGDLELSRVAAQALRGNSALATFSTARLREHLESNASEASFPAHLAPGGRYLKQGEAVLLTSHRADRARQIATLLGETQELYALVELGKGVRVSHVFFPQRPLTSGLAHELNRAGITSVRIAEKCKFPHVTYFLNGLDAAAEGRGLCLDSIPEQEIAQRPEMSAHDVTREILNVLRDPAARALVANLANLDQVGHLGNFELAKRAARVIDEAYASIAATAREFGWTLLITSDHGNADCVIDDRGRPFGSHTHSPVPLCSQPAPGLSQRWVNTQGTLANVAPTFLSALELPVPDFMAAALVEFEPRQGAT